MFVAVSFSSDIDTIHDITLRKSNMAMENPPFIDVVFPLKLV